MADSTPTYYYVNGQKVPLQRQEDLLAVKYRDADSSAATRSAPRSIRADVAEPGDEDIWPGGLTVLRRQPGRTRSIAGQDAEMKALSQDPDIEYASPVFEHGTGDQWIATNQFIAQFKDDFSEWDILSVNRHYQVEQAERVEWAPRTYLLQVTADSPGDALAVANAYVESGHVVFAHPNFVRKYVHRTPASQLLQPEDQHIDRYWHLRDIQAFDAWRITTGSPEVVVAIIDDAVDLDHRAFGIQTPAHFNAIDKSDNPRPPARNASSYTHGTACAGLAVGAANQAIGTSGVAPACKLMAVRLLDRVLSPMAQSQVDQVLSAEDSLALGRALSVVQPYREALSIQWAAGRGAHVISNSWGPPDGYVKHGMVYPIDDITRLALAYAVEKGRDGRGCVVCWAAGNGDESISYDGYASHPDVLAVGACTVEGKRASYSDYGPEVDLCAPGGGRRDGLLTTVDVDLGGRVAYRHDFNGTSAATPIVAGVAALILSQHPELSREEVYSILRQTADKIDVAGGEYSDGHSPYYGYGRVNARAALEEAARR